MTVIDIVQRDLFKMQDLEYKAFQEKLIPTVAPERVIGIRTPQLRQYAKAFAKREEAEEFLRALPHQYYEENNLHGFILETIKDYDRLIQELNAFLPYVDNWATCDMTVPKIFSRHLPQLREQIHIWLRSEDTYTVRFALGMLMRFYLDDAFDAGCLELAASVNSEEYYIQMMVAWYFATALTKQYEETIPYIEQGRLEEWTHNKAIQKAIESRRISEQRKEYLRTLKKK